MLSYENLTSGFVSSLRESASHSPANGLFPRFRKAEDPNIRRDHPRFARRQRSAPRLLLHGYPQTHVEWHKIGLQLAQGFTVVLTDLRGYGDSSKPVEGENHANDSKRTMALRSDRGDAGTRLRSLGCGRTRSQRSRGVAPNG